MSSSARLAFVVILVVNCIIWSQGRYGSIPHSQSLVADGRPSLVKRYLVELGYVNGTYDAFNHGEKSCRPLAFPTEAQCDHVRGSACPAPKTFLSVQYLSEYYCTTPALRPGVFVGLLIWLLFLFSTLGISASDFFTPNLATLAQLLGLDENVAGVTFLAFGNGSPDVFSTYSAMRAESGSLAIGELLGAASFIVSCVVGSMCIIKPFKVHRTPFLRDVGFFTVAVALLLVILWDELILPWEAGVLIALYVLYVFVVVGGSWWERRRERKRRTEAAIRGEYQEDELPEFHDEEPYRDHPTPHHSGTTDSLTIPSPTRARAHSSPGPLRLDIHTDLPPRMTRTPSPLASPRLSQMPSFSLIGALEFRQVVASLQHQAASPSLNMFESPVTPYAGGHYSRRPRSRTASQSHEIDPWDTALGVPLGERSAPHLMVTPVDNSDEPAGDEMHRSHSSLVPSISRTPASPTGSDGDTESQQFSPPTRGQKLLHVLARTVHILCPSLHHFGSKTFLGKIASLFAAPAVLALTLTLPVIVTPYESASLAEEKAQAASEGRLIDFEEEGIERALIAEEEVVEDMHEMKFNKWLMAAQCIFGPLFCVTVLFAGTKQMVWLIIAAVVAGLTVAILVLVFADTGIHPAARMARCSMGFFVAIVWIMAIADEVVQVLQTFGYIFGLSDAIIGLTIFAVGNSLADLVANMSVAVFAPIMGFSACFGGPMLNILLGVGVSGTTIMEQTQEPYPIKYSTTLIVSTIGLLVLLVTTMLVVPLNGYFLTRSWGIALIVAYAVIMAINVFVEISGF